MEPVIFRFISRNPTVALTTLFFLLTCFLRKDLDFDVLGLVGLYLVSVGLQTAPFLLAKKYRWNIGLSFLATILFFIIVGILFKGWAGFVLVAAFAILWKTHKRLQAADPHDGDANDRFRWTEWLVLSLSVLWLFSISVEGTWAVGYQSPFLKENILMAKVLVDPISHPAYAKMMQNFGVIGPGVHGLTAFKYHIGSHLLMIAASSVIHRPLDFVYPFGALLLLVPLLISSLHMTACEIAGVQSNRLRLGVFAAIAILITQLISVGILDRFGLWRSYFVSESYTFSLALLFAYVGSLWALYERSESRLGLLEGTILVLGLGLMTLGKISVGAIGCVLFGLFFLSIFLRNPKRAPFFVATLSASAAIAAERLTKIPMPADWVWNVFINDYGRSSPLKFHLVYYNHFWLFLAACGVLHFQGLLSKQIRFVLFAAIATFVASWPVLHLTIPGGSGYYFTNIVMWISLLGLVAAFATTTPRLRQVFLAVGFVVSFNNAEDSFRDVNALKREAVAVADSLKNPPMEIAAYRNFILELRKLRAHPPAERAFVFISSDEKGYWNAWPEPRRCLEPTLLLFHESDLPAIFGIPSHEDKLCWDYFQVQVWGSANYRSFPLVPDDEILCQEAERFGGSLVIKLSQVTGSDLVQRTDVRCSSNK